ncbi:MAG: DUF1573 domain-containing protein [Candidatus Omnitrophota bacterium]|nr:DUF1573 domain-containing protein [Candidatus Omnitrophota bacterium]
MMKIILVLLFLAFSLQGCYAQNQEKIITQTENADPYSWNFGQVKEGEVLRHAFVLKNESEKTLTIKDVNTSCGCTTSKVEKKILLPAETTDIEVQFNSKGYSGLAQQYVYVHTDSLDNSIIRFIIKAEVVTKDKQPKP